MVIIGLLMALVGPNLIGRSEKAKVQAAAMQIERLGTVLDTFRLDIGRYPTIAGRAVCAGAAPVRRGAVGRAVSQQGRPEGPVGSAVRVSQPRRSAAAPTTSTRSAPTARPAAQDNNRDVTNWGGDTG